MKEETQKKKIRKLAAEDRRRVDQLLAELGAKKFELGLIMGRGFGLNQPVELCTPPKKVPRIVGANYWLYQDGEIVGYYDTVGGT